MPQISDITFLFDIGDVILYYDHMISCRRLSDYSTISAEMIYKMILESPLESRLTKGEISFFQFYSEVKALAKAEIGFDEFTEFWNDIFTENPEMTELIKKLKSCHRLIILSNTNQPHFNYICQKFPVLGLFDDSILSYKVGFTKPDPRIFKLTIEKYATDPANIVYIDDKIENVEAAKRLGMRGIRFEDCGDLRRRLGS